jgi:hypothetical protein
MRKLLFIIVTTLIAACNSGITLKNYIQGSYVIEVLPKSEYSIVLGDTVTINSTGAAGSYIITRSTAWQAIRDGKVQQPAYSSKKESGVLNKDNGTIFTATNGITISFDPAHKKMMIQTAVYKKIK